ncbi:hypothetical protein [Streptomyces canus]|uniref:hypothetical protein n=1 Tax=Streptomyces canus TaxID=58343 RepID=UPI003CF3EDCA
MTGINPADELRTAATKLRSLVTFLGDNRGPWYVTIPERGYPQSISNVGVPYCVADCHEAPSIPVFTIAPYIATMHPGVGKALAQLLETAAEYVTDDFPARHAYPTHVVRAFAVARAINGGDR